VANADDVERVFRSDILPELVALLQPRGFKARVSRHDFIRRVSHGSQQLALLRSCYTGRRYDYIVDYAIRIEDERVRSIVRRWGAENPYGFGFFIGGSGLHNDVVPSSELFHRVGDPSQATSTMNAVLAHLADLIDEAEEKGYAAVFRSRGLPLQFIPYLAADAARRGQQAEALELLDRLPHRQAAVRAAAVEELS